MFGLKKEELDIIIQILKKYNVKECKVFGSRAKGNYNKFSDIDIAVSNNSVDISYELNEETDLPYYFDVLDFSNIQNGKIIEHIKRVGIELICL